MPQVVERTGQDRDEGAYADECEAELGAKRTEHEDSAADRTTGHRGGRRDERGDTPEGHAGVDEEVGRAPEGVPSEDPVPRHVPPRAEPAEQGPDEADDERKNGPHPGDVHAPE